VQDSALLRQTLAAADAILDLTKSITLTGQAEFVQQEADDYVTMVDNREPLVERFLQLKMQMDKSEAKAGENKKMPGYESLRNKVAEIVMLDKEQGKVIKGFRDSAQSSVKIIRNGRQLMEAYANPLEEASSGLLDRRQ